MNWIDKTVGWLNPRAGLERARYRLALQGISSEIQKLEYEAAKKNRRTSGWIRPGTSANAEVSSSLVVARDGARALERDNPQAKKAVIELATKAVGTGIRANARTGSDATNQRLDQVFEVWAEQTRWYQKQYLAAKAIILSGEVINRFRPRRPEDGLVVPFDVQLLEPDYIDHAKSTALDTGYIINGVEFDVVDREVAVWMYPSHPGDIVNTAWYRKKDSFVSRRIPVATSNPLEGVARAYREDRPGQVRGITWFHPIITALWDLHGYEEAERVRKRIEACLSGFITSPESDAGTTPMLGAQTTGSGGEIIEEFRPGMMTRLRPGEDIKVAEPKAAGGYIDYTRRWDRLIASGVGLLYELLTGDFSQINYSSYRGGLIGFKTFIETFQWLILVPFFNQTWRRFVDAAIIGGIVPAGTSYAVEWAPPAFELLDRKNEAEADEIELRIGKTTWPQMVARQGEDPNKQVEQITEWKPRLIDAGVKFDAKATAPQQEQAPTAA